MEADGNILQQSDGASDLSILYSGNIKTEPKNLLSYPPSSMFGNIISLAPTGMSQTGLSHGLVTMNSLPEQLMVAVQGVNGNMSVDEDDQKLEIIDTGSSSVSNAVQVDKISTTPVEPNLNSAGHILSSPALTGLIGYQGMPQVATIPGISMTAPLAAQMVNPAIRTNSAILANASGGGINATVSAGQAQVTATPQYIVASPTQQIQGFQGAQLLIPTSAGLASQQVVTIPVSHLAGNQIVQLVSSNGQIFTTTLANLQALSQTVPLGGAATPATSGIMQTQPLITTGNFPNVATPMSVPQIFTNANGQIVAYGPQVLSHPLLSASQPPNIIQVAPQLTAPQLHIQQEEKSSSSVTNGHSPQKTQLSQTTSFSSPPQILPVQHSSTQIAPNSVTVVESSTKQTDTEQKMQAQSTVSTLTQTVQPQNSVSSTILTNSADSISNTINNTEANVVDGINLEEIKEFAKAFKIRRLSLGLTQTQVGQALSATEGPSYSQSAICRFEKLDITPRSAQKIKPVLERWMKEAEERYKNGTHTLTEFIGSESTKKRKRRTSFTPAALEILNQFFEKNTHPSGVEMTELAEQLNYDREVVRVWFCNKRQALKNTIKKLKGGT